MSELVVGETTVKLIKGDITSESTEAIVNLSDAKLNRNVGVSKAIFDAAGPNVKEECERLAKLPNDGYVVTSAGNLNCCKIIHLIRIRSKNIVASVMKALKACDENNLETVSLPAMGTGAVKLKAEDSLRLIMKGIEDYLNDPSVMTIICEITIVVFAQDIYEKYQCFFQNHKTSRTHFSAFGKTIQLIKGDITHQAVDCIVNLTNASLNRSSGYLQRDGVKITSGGKLPSTYIMHIIGPKTIPAYEASIHKIMFESDEFLYPSVALPAIGTGAAKIDVEQSIKAILSNILKYLSSYSANFLKTISIIVIQESIYKKYLEVFQAKRTELQLFPREERIMPVVLKGATSCYPVTWTDIGRSEFQEEILEKTSQEYNHVKDEFFKTASASSYEVTEIKRIRNIPLWKSFNTKKLTVNKKYPGQNNIRHLYHGTHFAAISNINRDGFNRIYCGRNRTTYGNGTYFAVKSGYSCADRYSYPDENGYKYIYQAAVITGKYCEGNPSYKEAPHINSDPKQGRYNSVVDNVVNPRLFVVFHDDVAYPEYLITFKNR